METYISKARIYSRMGRHLRGGPGEMSKSMSFFNQEISPFPSRPPSLSPPFHDLEWIYPLETSLYSEVEVSRCFFIKADLFVTIPKVIDGWGERFILPSSSAIQLIIRLRVSHYGKD